MATLGEIERLARDYADARARLGETVQDLGDKQEALRRQYLPGIKRQVGIAKERRARLVAAIEDNPELFERPRTIIVHGIKIGLRKAKGIVEWASEETVIKLIKKCLPNQADLLIKTTEKLLKKPLQQLPGADLKKIGVTVRGAEDEPVIEPVDSEVDKLVEKLLKDEKNDEEEGAA
jgi:hypothetical protein